ncbi:transposon Ty3-I Gag-Pol polyprotein [Trichonephila clavipes]|nr:transposon Ty3-I Gag-Pol polyprotein [Trichonephila clavipes]
MQSGYGIGAVLVQIQNNVEKVIAYASRTLTKSRKELLFMTITTERECLAIVATWATNKFRPYIFGKHFTVVTDHHSLCWLMNLKDPSGRLCQMGLDFSMILTSHDEYEPCDGTEKGSRPCEIKTLSNSSKTKNSDLSTVSFAGRILIQMEKLWLPVIPKHLRADILRHFHDAPTAGHLGFKRKLMTGYARDFTCRECTEMWFGMSCIVGSAKGESLVPF